MSHYHHFCLAFSDLSGEVYTSSGAIVLSLTNGADGDRTVLTLSPMQMLVLSKGLRNIVKEQSVSRLFILMRCVLLRRRERKYECIV